MLHSTKTCVIFMVYSAPCDGFYSLTALKIRAPPYSRKVLEVGYGNPVRGDIKWVNQGRYETNGQRCAKLSALLDVCKLHWANKFQCLRTDTSSIGCLISSPSSCHQANADETTPRNAQLNHRPALLSLICCNSL